MRQPRPRLAVQRKTCGFTQEALAYALGVDRSTVARWEAGDTEPQPWLRPKLARALGISTDRLASLLTNERNGEPVSSVVTHRHAANAPSISRTDRRDPAAISQLAAQVADIALRYETRPSASLLAEAGQCHAALSFLLGQGGADKALHDLHQTATTSAIVRRVASDATAGGIRRIA